jgi:hypothetical protein
MILREASMNTKRRRKLDDPLLTLRACFVAIPYYKQTAYQTGHRGLHDILNGD